MYCVPIHVYTCVLMHVHMCVYECDRQYRGERLVWYRVTFLIPFYLSFVTGSLTEHGVHQFN